MTWLNSHSETGHAAQLCNDLIVEGYSDWFLPSKDELNLMYTNLKVYGVGVFVDGNYWSSSEGGEIHAWVQYFYNGDQAYSTESYDDVRVRAVRAFNHLSI